MTDILLCGKGRMFGQHLLSGVTLAVLGPGMLPSIPCCAEVLQCQQIRQFRQLRQCTAHLQLTF